MRASGTATRRHRATAQRELTTGSTLERLGSAAGRVEEPGGRRADRTDIATNAHDSNQNTTTQHRGQPTHSDSFVDEIASDTCAIDGGAAGTNQRNGPAENVRARS